jgi:hypothetical protein
LADFAHGVFTRTAQARVLPFRPLARRRLGGAAGAAMGAAIELSDGLARRRDRPDRRPMKDWPRQDTPTLHPPPRLDWRAAR